MKSKILSFVGGTHPPHRKHHTQNKAVEAALVPDMVVIPLHQHIGAPCEPLVKRGDLVKKGQRLGEPGGFVSVPVHSSVSGVVRSVEPVTVSTGDKVMSVIIENDGQDTLDDSIKKRKWQELSQEELKGIILDAGIVGMGGATFPSHVKLSPPPDKRIDSVILNGAECEPYLTADHRLMLERPHEVLEGLKVIMKILGVKRGYVGIEDNKPDALKVMTEAVNPQDSIEIKVLKTKYPQGGEKQLIAAITGRKVPSGGLPMDVGVIVNNVGTAAAIYQAVANGMPLIERIVTVTGNGVREPRNLLARIGTPFRLLIEQCGGFVGEPVKVVAGGPMMGLAQYDLDVPVTKGTSGILVLTGDEARGHAELPCIRCGKCVEVCPIHLMPLMISAYSLKGDYENSEELHALDCMECGSCSYICPARRPLMQSIRLAKREIILKKKRSV